MKIQKYALLTAVAAMGLIHASGSARAEDGKTVVDDWASVKVPAAPVLKPVKIDPKTTAFLVLDVVKQICLPSRPRCVAMVPKIKDFLAQARQHGVKVVYTLGGSATKADIIPDIAAKDDEPAISAHADKFIGTDLEKVLKDLHVTTLITVGVAGEGAVLYTASHAAFLNYNIVVPVDGVSSSDEFGELAAAWTLANAPGVGAKTTLTKFSLLSW